MIQTFNIISRLVESLETMALQYLSDYDLVNLEVDKQADLLCLDTLEKLGKVNKLCDGKYTWSRSSEYYALNSTLDSHKFLVKELPTTVTKEQVIKALADMAKEYLTYSNKNWMTHSFISAGQQTLDVFCNLGIVKTYDNLTYEWVESND